MLKLGDWVVIRGVSDRYNFLEGKVIRFYTDSQLVELWIEEEKQKKTINRKYLYRVKKEVTKEELINASLDLNMKDWFMSLTGENNG